MASTGQAVPEPVAGTRRSCAASFGSRTLLAELVCTEYLDSVWLKPNVGPIEDPSTLLTTGFRRGQTRRTSPVSRGNRLIKGQSFCPSRIRRPTLTHSIQIGMFELQLGASLLLQFQTPDGLVKVLAVAGPNTAHS